MVKDDICSKARRGTPTRILVNLCISLIALNIVLYVAERHGGSKLGCRMSNVSRYYFIFVSLLWNGIEAHNMYRMLILVFNTTGQSHFVFKAAIVAWSKLRNFFVMHV
jgi:7 transmembrane receptor (Secretin family)